MGVIDGKLRNKADKAEIYTKTYLDDPSNTLGANIATALKLKNARVITLGGDATGAVSFDGGAPVTLLVTVPGLTDKADKVNTLTPAEVDSRIQAIVGVAPLALDTLAEISAAFGDDPNFAASMTTALGNKANSVDVHTIIAADAKFLTKTGTAANATLFGNNAPAFYATASGLSALENEVADALTQLTTAFTNGATQINNIGV